MKLSRTIMKRILWPERASLFAIIGGGVGLSADITSFFSAFIDPYILLGIFAAIAATSVLLCLQRATLVDEKNPEAVEEVIHCRVCDSMRFSLFAVAAFILLMLIGQGQSATETIAEKIGLIHEDVRHIRADVTQINENVETVAQGVGEINDVIQAHKIVANPKEPIDYFTNAWIYTNMHRDAQSALKSLDAMYQKAGPQKLDAAELYFNSGRQILGRAELLKAMEEHALRYNDATLLVVAGRNADNDEESDRYYAKAREIAPDFPFAYWDIQKYATRQPAFNPDQKESLAKMKAEAASIQSFITHIGDKPANHYFFLPQYQPDHEMLARQTLASTQRNVESLEAAIQRLEEAQKMRTQRTRP